MRLPQYWTDIQADLALAVIDASHRLRTLLPVLAAAQLEYLANFRHFFGLRMPLKFCQHILSFTAACIDRYDNVARIRLLRGTTICSWLWLESLSCSQSKSVVELAVSIALPILTGKKSKKNLTIRDEYCADWWPKISAKVRAECYDNQQRVCYSYALYVNGI